ncbi:MAG: hypothetical protein PHH26_01970 [Candidatus Thermoplasmatota archaeon]|nr:hypothetical protein [Candidatus Thermoplasmatota archaeon]
MPQEAKGVGKDPAAGDAALAALMGADVGADRVVAETVRGAARPIFEPRDMRELIERSRLTSRQERMIPGWESICAQITGRTDYAFTQHVPNMLASGLGSQGWFMDKVAAMIKSMKGGESGGLKFPGLK